MRTLDTLRPGDSAVIRALHAAPGAVSRLYDMGLTPGANVTLLRPAPFGDPLVFSLRGYRLAIRKKDARRVEVEP